MRISSLSFLTSAYMLVASSIWIAVGRPFMALVWIAIGLGWLLAAVVRRLGRDRILPNGGAVLKRRMLRLLLLS